MRLIFITIPLILFFLSSTGQGISEELETIRTNRNIVGLAVGISCNGEVLETYYGGVANISANQELTEETMFRVASVSKMFTATALLSLYDQGLFELDDDISNYLGYTVRNPQYPETAISFKMLLNHTSTLEDGAWYDNFLTATYQGGDVPNISELITETGSFYNANMYLEEMPGFYFSYSNINFGIIGTLIEAISGMRFDQYISSAILQPLEINGGYNLNTVSDIGNLSVLYRNSIPQIDDLNGINPPPLLNEDYVPGTNGLVFAPQGGLRCTLSDLLNFADCLLNGGSFNGNTVLEPATVQLMLQSHWFYTGLNGDNYYGLFNSWGLGVHRAAGLYDDTVIPQTTMIGHPGEAYGLISDLYLDPETGLALAFISNGYYPGGSYQLGLNSAFYLPEEEVFELIAENYYDACQSLSTNTPSALATKYCNDVNTGGGTINISEELIGGHLTVVSMQGQKIQSQVLNSLRTELSGLQGPYCLHIQKNDRTCIQKTVIIP